MSGLTEHGLLRGVARVQHDKTLQLVRDLVDSIPTQSTDRNGLSGSRRHAKAFRDDLVRGLQGLRDAERAEQ